MPKPDPTFQLPASPLCTLLMEITRQDSQTEDHDIMDVMRSHVLLLIQQAKKEPSNSYSPHVDNNADNDD